jgi:uncharacterized membrane protein
VFLQITARPDARLVAAAIRRGLRHPMLLARCLGWAFLGLALLLADGGLNVTLLLVGVLLAIGVPMVLTNAGMRQAMRDGELTTWEISDGGVASSSLASRHSYAWHAFSHVEQMSGQLIFGRGRTRFLPVPTAGLSAEQIEQVLGTAAGHGLRVRRC